MYLNVASRLDSCVQDLSREMVTILFLFAFAFLYLQCQRNRGVKLMGPLQVRPEVLKIILSGKKKVNITFLILLSPGDGLTVREIVMTL